MNEYHRKVNYYETDKMAITHHSNYIRWMEEARVAFLNELGWGYERFEAMGVVSPVVYVDCKYMAPTAFAEEVIITVRVEEFKGVKLKLSYEMKKPDGTQVCVAHSEHCFMDTQGHFVRLKKDYPDLYNTLLEAGTVTNG